MNLSHSPRALFGAFAALAGLVPLSQAQTVATSPVGMLTHSFKPGTQLAGISLVRPAVATGVIQSASGPTVISGSVSYGALLNADSFYYIEITEDEANASLYEGDRFDVDTASTMAASAGTIVLKPSAENTITGNPPPALAGARFVLREHHTLGGLLADMPGAFRASDEITLRRDGTSHITATLNAAETTWRAGLTNCNDVIVYPGVGFFLVRNGSHVTSVALTGTVRANAFVQIIKAGEQVIAEGFPVHAAPGPASGASRLFTNSAGGTFATGDTLAAYNPAGQLVTYKFNAANNRWMAGLTNGTALNLFHPTTASYLTAASENRHYVQLVPFNL